LRNLFVADANLFRRERTCRRQRLHQTRLPEVPER
jgi:hypothetical protein